MRADLIPPNTFKSVVEAVDFGKMIEILSETSYKDELSNFQLRAAGVERALNLSFVKRLEHIIGVSPKEISNFLSVYYFMGLEIQNLKRIVKGKYAGIPTNQIMDSLIPLRPYLSVRFESLLEAENLDELADNLAATIYAPVKTAVELCREYDVLWPIDSWLNGIYVHQVLEPISRLRPDDRVTVKEILQTQIDVENLLAADNWRRESGGQVPPKDLFPHSYRISWDILVRLIEGADSGKVLQGLDPPYDDIMLPLLAEEDRALVRRNLRAYVYAVAERSRRRNDFGFPCIFSLLASFEVEKDDLVSIAWGKERGVQLEKIIKYAVLPSYSNKE